MNILIVSTSLNAESKSYQLALAVRAVLEGTGARVQFIDLRKDPLPMFDGSGESESAGVQALQRAAQSADGIILSGAVYSWSISASAKNAAEWIGDGFRRKVVGFAGAAGGMRAYLAPLGLLGSIMLDYEANLVPRIFLADSKGFEGESLTPETAKRAEEFGNLFREICAKLAPAR